MDNELIKGYYSVLFKESHDCDWDNIISEALISFNGKQYPKFNQVVIVAGGAGSGKGFVIDNLFGITGKRYDVDYLKNEVTRNKELRKQLAEKFGVDESVFDLNTSEDVSIVHNIMKRSGLKNKYEANIFKMAELAAEDRKPNLIFDKTCSTITDILDIATICLDIGYKAENIHLIWVLNDIQTALKQNSERARRVPNEILESLHYEVANTMKRFLNKYDTWLIKPEGDIYICFNKRNIDTKATKLKNGKFNNKENFYVDKANYIKVKSAGNNTIDIPEDIMKKIKMYTPMETW